MMRSAETILSILRKKPSGVTVAGEPRDTEIGHAWFGCDVKSCVLSKLTGGLIALSETLFSLLSHNRVADPAYTASK